MKTFLQCVASLYLIVAGLAPAFAQITITAADVSAALTLGSTLTSKSDTVTATANIGTLGSTSWNFSALNTNLISIATSVRPDTTPLFGFFPGSTHAQRIDVGIGIVYSYLKLGTHLLFPGIGLTGDFQLRTRNIPDEVLYQLPMTLGTSWTTAYAESSIVVFLPPPFPPQVTITDYSVTNTVDAYGNLTLPGGGVHQALRLRIDRRSTSVSGSDRTISYTILAHNGASVNISAEDTLQPNTGTINVSGISWNGPVSTSVRLDEGLPGDFALMQNYPNPFNPSTTIEFDLPRSSFVNLVVVNVLGEEVATVVNGQLPPGRYRETFNAANLPSGVYFYKLQTSETSIVRKMLLVR